MTNLLWITNIMLPPVCKAINVKDRPVGGWMYSSLRRLPKNRFNIAVATIYNGETFTKYEIDGITYYLLPQKSRRKTYYNKDLEKYWKVIQKEFSPKVIHVHGSEYPLGLSWVKVNVNKGVICSIQGLISVYARYYNGGLAIKDLKNSSIRDFIYGTGLLAQQKDFQRRGKLEIEFIQSIGHIIGRTDWDRSHTWAINPKAEYYYCGETLREPFYKNQWSYDKCNKHSIFASQAGYAIKGFHKLLMAFPLILSNYPDAKIYLTGTNPFDIPTYKIGSYALYIKRLITKLNIKDKVIFLGSLDEDKMCEQFLKCNVFVCPSSIENSPNSLGEAQIMGVPHVASFVGGIPEIVEYNRNVLYRFDEHEMLARKIIDIFQMGSCYKLSEFDNRRYDGEYNTECLIQAYNKVEANYE